MGERWGSSGGGGASESIHRLIDAQNGEIENSRLVNNDEDRTG